MSAHDTDFAADEKQAYRLESKWTDAETAHELRDRLIAAGVDADKIVIAERRIEVDQTP